MDEMLKARFVFGWKVILYLFLAGMGGGSAAVVLPSISFIPGLKSSQWQP